MKNSCFFHAKTEDLADRLGLPLSQAGGILEYLWYAVGKQFPDGALGKSKKTVARFIALSVKWKTKDAMRLMNALLMEDDTNERDEESERTLSPWIDLDPEHGGYMVHDWWDHCELSIHKKMAIAHRFFADGKAPKLSMVPAKLKPDLIAFYANATPDSPSPQQPDLFNQKKPEPAPPDTSHLPLEAWWKAFHAEYPRKIKKKEAKARFIEKAVSEEIFQTIMLGLARFNADIIAKKTGETFIINPASWLFQELWTNEYNTQLFPEDDGPDDPGPSREQVLAAEGIDPDDEA